MNNYQKMFEVMTNGGKDEYDRRDIATKTYSADSGSTATATVSVTEKDGETVNVSTYVITSGGMAYTTIGYVEAVEVAEKLVNAWNDHDESFEDFLVKRQEKIEKAKREMKNVIYGI